MPKPVVSGTAPRACLREQCCGDQAGPEEGAETSLSPGPPDKPAWGSRNGNQSKTNLFLQLAGSFHRSLLSPWHFHSFLLTAELSPALLSQLLSSINCLFNLKPQLHAASLGKEPVLPAALAQQGKAPEQEPAFGELSKRRTGFQPLRDSQGEGSMREGLMRLD